MSVYHVSYDLRGEGSNYSVKHAMVTAELGRTEHRHPMDSTWLIHTQETAQQLAMRVMAHLDNNDRLLVTAIRPPVGPSYWGSLDSDDWTWVAARAQ